MQSIEENGAENPAPSLSQCPSECAATVRPNGLAVKSNLTNLGETNIVPLSPTGRPIYPVLPPAAKPASETSGASTSAYTGEDGEAEQPKWATLLGCSNDGATLMRECRPWEFVPNAPSFSSKDEYLKWRGDDSTEHLLFTGGSGVNKDLRANKKTNPVAHLNALIADYDSKITDAMEESALRNAPADLRPNWISKTYSGGRRLVWLFSEPVPFDDVIAKRFFEVAGNELRVSSLLPGIDKNFSNPYQVFDVGTNWRQLSDKPLSSNVIHLWLFEASKRTDWSKVGDLQIPFEDVREAVIEKFGDVLHGDFEINQRTNAFWDGGDNPTAAVVTENGMVCFSRHKIFFGWGEILGAAFCRKYQADRIGAAVTDLWFDGKSYHRKINGLWHSVSKDDLAMWLRTERGLDPSKEKKATHSEVDRALVFVQENRRVAGVIPCLFDQRDIIEQNGKRFLNCSCVKPIQPHEEPQTWATNFPWIAQFLELRFDETERQYLLGWWQRFYGSALQGDLLKGHSLFVVGGINLGKTLFSYRMVGASVGGCADATAHITKGSEFNKELGEVALWSIDDGEVATDARSHARFSEAIKRMVANPTMVYRAMFRDGQTIQHGGRILVTLNDDAYSLNLIPDLATSMEEKCMVLYARNTPYLFPPKHVLEPMIAAELPYFLRWLVDWEMPDEVKGENRLGVKSYINEELRFKALAAGQTGTLLEIVELWKKRNDFEAEFWLGTASEFYSQVAADEMLKSLIGKFSPKAIGKQFTDAASIRDSGIKVEATYKNKSSVYRISVKPDNSCKRKAHRVSLSSES